MNETFSSNKQNQSSSYKVNNEYRNHPYNRTNKKPTTTTTIIARSISLIAESALGAEFKVIDSMIVLQSTLTRKKKLLEIMIHI